MKSRKMSKTKLGLALITFLSSGVTLAAGETSSGMDLSSLTNSVDFSPVTIAILAIAGSLITLCMLCRCTFCIANGERGVASD